MEDQMTGDRWAHELNEEDAKVWLAKRKELCQHPPGWHEGLLILVLFIVNGVIGLAIGFIMGYAAGVVFG
jgi:hypothetical protein